MALLDRLPDLGPSLALVLEDLGGIEVAAFARGFAAGRAARAAGSAAPVVGPTPAPDPGPWVQTTSAYGEPVWPRETSGGHANHSQTPPPSRTSAAASSSAYHRCWCTYSPWILPEETSHGQRRGAEDSPSAARDAADRAPAEILPAPVTPP